MASAHLTNSRKELSVLVYFSLQDIQDHYISHARDELSQLFFFIIYQNGYQLDLYY